MLVVRFVARIAILAQLDAVNIAFVAVRAFRGLVLSPQRVLRIHVMIKAGRLPGLGVVTAFTFFAKLALVPFLIVIFTVAANTRSRRVLVLTGFMATAALHINVLAGQ